MDIIEMLLGCGDAVTDRPTSEVEISRLSDMIGQPFIVKIHALTAKELDDAPKDDFKAHVILAAVESPDLRDSRLAERLKPKGRSTKLTPAETVAALLLPGEVVGLYNAITDLSGFGEDCVKEIKKN